MYAYILMTEKLCHISHQSPFFRNFIFLLTCYKEKTSNLNKNLLLKNFQPDLYSEQWARFNRIHASSAMKGLWQLRNILMCDEIHNTYQYLPQYLKQEPDSPSAGIP